MSTYRHTHTLWLPPLPSPAAYKTKQHCINMHLNYQPAVLLQHIQMKIHSYFKKRKLSASKKRPCICEGCPAFMSVHIQQQKEVCVFVCVRKPHVHTCIHTHTQAAKCKNKNTHLDRLKINGEMGWALSCLSPSLSVFCLSVCLQTLQCITTA